MKLKRKVKRVRFGIFQNGGHMFDMIYVRSWEAGTWWLCNEVKIGLGRRK